LVLNKKERSAFLVLLLFVLVSNFFFIRAIYLKYTIEVPAKGGVIQEAMIGQPHLVNPIYSSANDIDDDLTKILFNGLLKFDKNNEVIPDLAKSFEIKEQGRIYEIKLKDKIFWHDNNSLTIDDIIYTIKTIQDPSYKSPLRVRWLGVSVEKQDEDTIGFFLEKAYPPFLETLATTKIMPKHIWQNIPAENFPLVEYNLQKIIGSGPYKVEQIIFGKEHNIEKMALVENKLYFDKKPYIPRIVLNFYPDENTLLSKVKNQDSISFVLNSAENFSNLSREAKLLQMPRYFALFINQNKSWDEKIKSNQFLRNKNIVQAINLAIDKENLIKEALNKKALTVYSPILPDFYGINYENPSKKYDPDLAAELIKKEGFQKNNDGFWVKVVKNPKTSLTSNLSKGSKGEQVSFLQECLARDKSVYPEGEVSGYFGSNTEKAVINFQEKYKSEILEPAGLEKGTGTVRADTRDKINELCSKNPEETIILEITITTIDQDILIKSAEKIKNDLEKFGVKTNILSYDFSSLKENVIKPRDFQAILFGEILGKYPDLFPFWHSSEKNDPGLNLSGFENKKADGILKEIKQVLDDEKRNKLLIDFAKIIEDEKPAIFLFNPYYIYYLSPQIKNFGEEKILLPSERFKNITERFIKTKRELKK
jgi:ABC-type transport system substrate-binding protein